MAPASRMKCGLASRLSHQAITYGCYAYVRDFTQPAEKFSSFQPTHLHFQRLNRQLAFYYYELLECCLLRVFRMAFRWVVVVPLLVLVFGFERQWESGISCLLVLCKRGKGRCPLIWRQERWIWLWKAFSNHLRSHILPHPSQKKSAYSAHQDKQQD